MHRPRRPRPVPLLGVFLGGLLLAGAPACSSESAGSTDPGSSTTTTADPMPSEDGVLDDQEPPESTYGLAWHDGLIWVADFDGGQVVAAEPDTGLLRVRWTGDDGVTKGINDLVIGPDGAVYWTGFDDGSVDRMSGGNFVPIAAFEPGVNAIAFHPDGRLFVARGDEGQKEGGDGIYQVDPRGEKPAVGPVVDGLGGVNAFAFAADGTLYAPRAGTGKGSGTLVAVDVDRGTVDEVAGGFDDPVAVKLSPDGASAYVLSAFPPALSRVDLATGTVTLVATPATPFVNNLVVAPDGRIFISSIDGPVLTVVAPDGTTSELTLGRPGDAAPPGDADPEP